MENNLLHLQHVCIKLSIGNTDFQIIFVPNDSYMHHVNNLLHSAPVWFAWQHSHLFCECHFLRKGKVSIKTDQQEYLFNENSFCVLPAKLPHSIVPLHDAFERITFYVVIAKNKNSLTNTFESYDKIFSASEPIICDKMSNVFNQIFELAETTPMQNSLLELKLKHLFALAFIELLEYNHQSDSFERSQNTIDYTDELKLKLEAFIEHFILGAQLNDLAQYLCLSQRQTDRLLNDVFHCGFQELKTQKRMSIAKKLLGNSDYSLKKIAETVGFSSYTGFHNAFKQFTGLSPEEYRASLQ